MQESYALSTSRRVQIARVDGIVFIPSKIGSRAGLSADLPGALARAQDSTGRQSRALT